MKKTRIIKKKAAPILLFLMASMLLLSACQNKESVSENGEGNVNQELNDSVNEVNAMIMEFENMYMNPIQDTVEISQIGNTIVGNCELSAPLFLDAEADSTWMGYSEMELGFLTPEEMPNVFDTISETGMNVPAVMYENEIYYYVNDYTVDLEKIVAKYGSYELRQVLEEYKKYSDVWVTSAVYVEDIKILGGLEEYGKQCAKQGGNAE